MLLNIIFAFILQVFAVVPGSDAVAELVRGDVVNLKIPRYMATEFLYKIAGYPTELIKSYPTDSLLLNGYHVLVSEAFRNTKIHKIPETYYGQILVDHLQPVDFQMPENAAEWGYGQQRFLVSKDFVKMRQRTRQYERHQWIIHENVEAKVTAAATRYKDVEGRDVVLIEKIVNVVPRNPPQSYYQFRTDYPEKDAEGRNLIFFSKTIDGVIVNPAPHFYKYYLSVGDYGVGMSEAAHAAHLIATGLPATYLESNIALTVAEPTNFKIPDDFSNWKPGESRTLVSDQRVYVLYRSREVKQFTWREGRARKAFAKAKVTRYKAPGINGDNQRKDLFIIHEVTTDWNYLNFL